MRLSCLLILFAILACGCARNKPSPITSSYTPPGFITRSPSGASTNSTLIVTPSQQLAGRLASVNRTSRFAIVTFPLGTMPRVELRMNVYRKGLKVGEIKISGPQRDINIAADIIAGECQVGDEVKTD